MATTDSTPTAESTRTVFVVDDDPETRKSIHWLLQDSPLNVRLFASAEEFLQGYQVTHPACLVLDINMPGVSGLDLQAQLAGVGIVLPVIVITSYAEVSSAVQAMKAGALDYLQKPFTRQALLDCVNSALDRDLATHAQHADRHAVAQKLERLSAGEKEVVDLLIDGLSNKEISVRLGLSRRGVEARRANIMKKMEAESLAELVRMVLASRA